MQNFGSTMAFLGLIIGVATGALSYFKGPEMIGGLEGFLLLIGLSAVMMILGVFILEFFDDDDEDDEEDDDD